MESTEFDRFADEYSENHRESLSITGEDPDYFHRFKVNELRRLYRRENLPAPTRILDFGCGVGNSIPHLRTAFPAAELVGLDVSKRSLEIAEHRFPGIAEFILYREESSLSELEGFDLIFSACVFHHVDAVDHGSILKVLRSRIRPGGALVIFEHNPLNPVTQHIVASCEFDANAVLIRATRLAGLQRTAGFSKVQTRFVGFFPAKLKALRRFEPLIHFFPLGAQYYTFAYEH